MAQGSRVFVELYSDSKIITPRATASVNNSKSLAYRERAGGREGGREGTTQHLPQVPASQHVTCGIHLYIGTLLNAH